MPKYNYYADWAGGSLIDSSLKKLCKRIREKFDYLHYIPDCIKPGGGPCSSEDIFLWNNLNKTGLDPGYLARNCFGRKNRSRGRSGYRFNLLNSEAWLLGYEHDIKIGRLKL